MFERLVDQELERLGLFLSKDVRSHLSLFASELVRWNRSVNLTSLSSESLVQRLIAEPVWIGHQLQMSGCMMDIGSGNGSPAFPLWITRPFERMTLVEARGRRAAFLRHIKGLLGAQGISVRRCRLEELEEKLKSDWITLQAINPTRELLDSLRRHLQSTTTIVWITSHREAPVASASRICVPGSSTEGWIFQLDQF